MMTIAGVRHALEYWPETKRAIDSISHNLDKITIEMPKNTIRIAEALVRLNTAERAGYYTTILACKAQHEPDVEAQIKKYLEDGGLTINYKDLISNLRKIVAKNPESAVAEITSTEYLRSLAGYCDSKGIELIPMGKTGYRTMAMHKYNYNSSKSHMLTALAEKELAREIKMNNAPLNIVGKNHALPIVMLLIKSMVPAKLIYLPRGGRIVPGFKTLLFGHLPLFVRRVGKKIKYATRGLRNKRIK